MTSTSNYLQNKKERRFLEHSLYGIRRNDKINVYDDLIMNKMNNRIILFSNITL